MTKPVAKQQKSEREINYDYAQGTSPNSAQIQPSREPVFWIRGVRFMPFFNDKRRTTHDTQKIGCLSIISFS